MTPATAAVDPHAWIPAKAKFTTEEAAALIFGEGSNRDRVLRLIHSGEINARRLTRGGGFFITRAEIIRLSQEDAAAPLGAIQ